MGSRLMPLCLAACSLVLLACQERSEEHLLFRAGYGPDAWTRARIAELGLRGYTEEQLHPESIPDPAYEAREAASRPLVAKSYLDIHETAAGDEDEILLEARILRAVTSRRQLRAVLIDFWFDHFNVDVQSRLRREALAPYERRHIAPHVLGRFEDLLIAVATSPAMLDYLDNDENSVHGLNENYARELLELHTLGVDGPYGEEDVREVARTFTGWTLDRDGQDGASGFRFRAEWHDPAPKTVLGIELSAGGMEDGLHLLRILARHPATAEHVSRKLVRHFVSEEPPAGLVRALTETWRRTGGDLRAVMRRLLMSPAFRVAPLSEPSRVKRPFVLLTGLARALGATDDPAIGWIRQGLRRMGETPYHVPSPAGSPKTSSHWAGNGMLLGRIDTLRDIARGRSDVEFEVPIAGTDEALVDAWIDRLFVRPVSPDTRQAVVAFIGALPPHRRDDRDRVSREALALLLASPEYLTH